MTLSVTGSSQMKAAECRQLKLQLSWVLGNDKSHDRFLESYRNFFARQGHASFGEVYRRQNKALYEEDIYQLDCVLNWEATDWFGSQSKYLQIGQAWCEAKQEVHGVFQWLTPNPLEAFHQATHPSDREVGLLSVAFGTLVGLETFVEHHFFSSRLRDEHRNYRLKACFQHDQRMLHVELHLNHKPGCQGKVTEYKFMVPYTNILKVVFYTNSFSFGRRGLIIQPMSSLWL